MARRTKGRSPASGKRVAQYLPPKPPNPQHVYASLRWPIAAKEIRQRIIETEGVMKDLNDLADAGAAIDTVVWCLVCIAIRSQAEEDGESAEAFYMDPKFIQEIHEMATKIERANCSDSRDRCEVTSMKFWGIFIASPRPDSRYPVRRAYQNLPKGLRQYANDFEARVKTKKKARGSALKPTTKHTVYLLNHVLVSTRKPRYPHVQRLLRAAYATVGVDWDRSLKSLSQLWEKNPQFYNLPDDSPSLPPIGGLIGVDFQEPLGMMGLSNAPSYIPESKKRT